jgi:hypothetical protein
VSRRADPRHRRAGTGAQFLPTQLAGCVLWLRADLGITIGTGVSAWADQSGTGDSNKNVTQGTGSQQPTRNAVDAAYNNQTTLSFSSAANQFLSSGTWASSLSPPFTFFIVGNDDGTATEQLYCDQKQGAANETSFYNPSGGFYGAIHAGGSFVSTLAVSNAKRVAAVVVNGASSVMYCNARTSIGTGTLGAGSLVGVTMGASVANTLWINGKIAEAIYYNTAFAPGQVAQIFAYAGARYGITIGS